MEDNVLKGLNNELKERKIASRLSDDKEVLSVFFPERLAGTEAVGDIYHIPFPGDSGKGGYYRIEFSLGEVTAVSDKIMIDLSSAAVILNSSLPSGGYGIKGSTYETEDEEGRKVLVYAVSVPALPEFEDDLLVKELIQSLTAASAVLKATAPSLLKLSKGEISIKDFMESMVALS